MEFQKGDVVHIVQNPVDTGPGWVRDMNEYCGAEARINKVYCADDYKPYYDLRINGSVTRFYWCAEMFQEFYGAYVPESEEESLIDVDLQSLFGALHY